MFLLFLWHYVPIYGIRGVKQDVQVGGDGRLFVAVLLEVGFAGEL